MYLLDRLRFKAIGIDMANKELALDVAEQLVEEGYQMIELCGGFGPEWAFKVSERLKNKIPVGAVCGELLSQRKNQGVRKGWLFFLFFELQSRFM